MVAIPIDSNPAPQLRSYPASGIGSIALECIQPEIEGTVLGVSSRGIFIKTSTRWIIFISHEPYPGPLTISVPGIGDAAIELESGYQVGIASGKLAFTDADLVITARNINAWQPKPPVSFILSTSERHKRLIAASKRVTRSDQPDDFSALLPYLIPMPEQMQIEVDQISPLYKQVLNLYSDTNGLPSPAVLIELLGAGPGLTPSGDDFAIGFLLALNRWQRIFPTLRNLDNFSQQIVAAAYQKTTTLSANLIECASQGLADQRLIAALDWLVSEGEDGVQIIDELLTWGSSSGRDAFVGFAAALELVE